MTYQELIAELKRENEALFKRKDSHNRQPSGTATGVLKQRRKRREANRSLRRYYA